MAARPAGENCCPQRHILCPRTRLWLLQMCIGYTLNKTQEKGLFSHNNASMSVFLLVKHCGSQPGIMPFPSLVLAEI